MRQTVYFEKRGEEEQNPYIGFMSFQHFRGEKLYSDIVVLPENNFCETERVECYPVSSDAEELENGEAYYLDTKMVYIRILWKEFEPRRGEYNYSFIEKILFEAKKHGQSLIFRLMPHSTRECDDVPEWLKELVNCPARPNGARVVLNDYYILVFHTNVPPKKFYTLLPYYTFLEHQNCRVRTDILNKIQV